MQDVRGVTVSNVDSTTLEHFEKALLAYQTYFGDAVEHIEAALARSPDFVLGHAFRATALAGTTERRFIDEARRSVEAAETLSDQANDRERGLTAAARSLVDGQWDTACRQFDRVLQAHPTDVFALQSAHLFDFLRGDALNLRNRVARVLPSWSPTIPGYSYVLGMHAFGLEECNEYPAAEAAGRRALAIEARDPWAVHAVTHVMEMQGRVDDGIEWLEARTSDWAPDNGFAFHNWWHLALFHLDRGDSRRALAIFDDAILPGAEDYAMGLVDVTSLLWRLQLLGVDLGDRFASVADVWGSKLDPELGHYAFNDFHAALAFAGADRGDALGKLSAGVAQRASDGAGFLCDIASDVGVPLVQGIQAFQSRQYARALELISNVRDVANAFGGSHAQRDVITLTMIVAAQRAGQHDVARHYLNERLVTKPSSGLGWRLLEA